MENFSTIQDPPRIPAFVTDGPSVIAPNNFWLQLHHLAEAFNAEGLTTQERVQNTLAQFQGMAPIAQKELVADLLLVSVHIPELFAILQTAVNQLENSRRVMQPTVA